MAKISPLTDELATRARSLDFSALGQWLPNPDPILKAQGKDIAVYRDLRGDALIGACIRRRKSAVKALEWGLDRGQAASRTAKAVQAMLAGLDLERIIGQMLEATLYGYQPMEVEWRRVGGLLVPADVQAKPPEWFCFDSDNALRFKTRQAPLLGELLPDYKFLLPRQDPTYQNPYGFADLSLCFWPLVFKKGGMKFWLAFAEKFGSAFSVGTLPRSATNEERTQLLDSLEALIQDGVAVIPDDGTVDFKEASGKSASADLYERLVLHCRGEIAIALLGQNQTTEATSNKASASAGLQVGEDLRDGDAKIVAACMNQLIGWVCQLNWPGQAVPSWSLWDQQAQDQLQAARDKSNFDAGARFTNAYWQRAYGYQEGDLAEPAVSPPVIPAPLSVIPAPLSVIPALSRNPSPDPAFAESPSVIAAAPSVIAAAPSVIPALSRNPSPDPTQPDTDALMTAAAPEWTGLLDQIETLVASAPDTATLQQRLTQAYGGLDSAQLVKLMAAGLALAELKGMDAARSEAESSVKGKR